MIRALALVSTVIALALVSSAGAADRMWIGFHDDPTFRFGEDRQSQLTAARARNASLVRTLVEWHLVAPTRPRNARNPFDPAYKFDDLDEFVRNAQQRGMEVLITLWGTPGWANGGKKPAFAPRRMTDFRNFAAAVARRYSGAYPGFPFVRFYGIWNESNISLFLAPQFNAKGKIVSPATYAKLAQAGITGIKSTSPKALVAIGETSSTGRDKPRKGSGADTVAPATFARMVAQASNGKLKFDAWAQHPYPFPVNMKPTQRVRYPNVTLLSFPQFGEDLDKWFGRKDIPIWITEYGHETKPGEPKGVTEAVQARYASQAISLAKAFPRVEIFVWFVFRDSKSSLWQSGLYRPDGSTRPSAATWRRAAGNVDAINGRVETKAGSKNPSVTVFLREYCSNNPIGAPVGATVRVLLAGKVIAVTQSEAPLGRDCTIDVKAPVTVDKGKTYTVTVDANTKVTAPASRTITLVGV